MAIWGASHGLRSKSLGPYSIAHLLPPPPSCTPPLTSIFLTSVLSNSKLQREIGYSEKGDKWRKQGSGCLFSCPTAMLSVFYVSLKATSLQYPDQINQNPHSITRTKNKLPRDLLDFLEVGLLFLVILTPFPLIPFPISHTRKMPGRCFQWRIEDHGKRPHSAPQLLI